MLLLSRLAESLYWIGRYVERAENTARLVNVSYYASLESTSGARGYWKPLLELMGGEASVRAKYGRIDSRSVSSWMAVDRDNPSSIASSLMYARENARGLRDRIPSEMWESINRSYLKLCFENDRVLDNDGLFEYCAAARDASQFFFGIAVATLPRDESWAFMRAGQMLERGDNTLRVMRGRFSKSSMLENESTMQDQRWISVLKGFSAYEAYRKRVHSGVDPINVADFLILDDYFPRSVRYSAERLHDALTQIENWHPAQHPEIIRQVRWLVAKLQYAKIQDILENDSPALDVLIGDFGRVGAAVHSAYFQKD